MKTCQQPGLSVRSRGCRPIHDGSFDHSRPLSEVGLPVAGSWRAQENGHFMWAWGSTITRRLQKLGKAGWPEDPEQQQSSMSSNPWFLGENDTHTRHSSDCAAWGSHFGTHAVRNPGHNMFRLMLVSSQDCGATDHDAEAQQPFLTRFGEDRQATDAGTVANASQCLPTIFEDAGFFASAQSTE